jgi:O-antigen ligase
MSVLSFPLAALCLGAAYGKGAEVLAGIGCLVAIMSMIRDGVPSWHRATIAVATVFAVYFLFFTLHDTFFTRDILASVAEMRVNLPILFSVTLCLHAAREADWLNAEAIGRVVTWSTLAICLLSAILYLYVTHHSNLPHILDETVADGRFRFHARNALMFASQLTGLSFLSLLGHARRSRMDRHLAEIACVLGTLVVLLLAQARGATLTALLLAVVALWYVRPSLEFPRLKLALGVMAVVSATLWLSLEPGAGRNIITRFGSAVGMAGGVSAVDGSTSQRLAMYEAGWHAFLEQPLTGYGYSRRFEAATAFFPPGLDLSYTHLHNDYLTHLVAAGIPGILVFLAYVCLPLAVLVLTGRPSRDLKYMAFTGTLLMGGIASTTAILGHDIHTTYFSMLIIMTLTVALGEDRKGQDHEVPLS